MVDSRSRITKSINLAKLAGEPWSPIGVTVQWKRVDLPGTENAVYSRLSSSNSCCQKPLVRSSEEKILDRRFPTVSTQSRISRIWYLSGKLAKFNFR